MKETLAALDEMINLHVLGVMGAFMALALVFKLGTWMIKRTNNLFATDGRPYYSPRYLTDECDEEPDQEDRPEIILPYYAKRRDPNHPIRD
jgi:hypothetical protein